MYTFSGKKLHCWVGNPFSFLLVVPNCLLFTSWSHVLCAQREQIYALYWNKEKDKKELNMQNSANNRTRWTLIFDTLQKKPGDFPLDPVMSLTKRRRAFLSAHVLFSLWWCCVRWWYSLRRTKTGVLLGDLARFLSTTPILGLLVLILSKNKEPGLLLVLPSLMGFLLLYRKCTGNIS